jgi:microsomal dipeptidase-like Zn-dependent dipeptidase
MPVISWRAKRWIQRVAAAVAVFGVALAVSLYTWAPGVVMNLLNRPRESGPYSVPDTVRTLHQSLVVADLHCDSLLWPRDLLRRDSRGALDVPRLIEGGVALQSFYAVTCAPMIFDVRNTGSAPDIMAPVVFVHGWPAATWFSPRARALHMAATLDQYGQRSNGKLEVIHTREDLDRYLERRTQQPEITAGLLGAEGMYCLEGALENVRVLYDAGYRIIGPTHYTDCEAGGSAHGRSQRGLTDFGAKAVRAMERHKMLVDLAHASPALIDDVLTISTRPVMVSHTGLKGICDNARTLDDARAKRIAERGGLIGIGFWDKAVCGTTPRDIALSIRYAVDLLGADHVAIGSDFDGCTRPPFDASGMPLLTGALLDEGLFPADIAKIMGGNMIRLLRETLPSENEKLPQG